MVIFVIAGVDASDFATTALHFILVVGYGTAYKHKYSTNFCVVWFRRSPSTVRRPSTTLHGGTTQKIVLFIVAVVKTSNPTNFGMWYYLTVNTTMSKINKPILLY
jgi:hypothetical protein